MSFLGGQRQRRALRFRVKRFRYRGTGQTVRVMRDLAKRGQANPAVRHFATSVIRQVTPRDYLSELAALYFEVCRRVRYVRDPAGVEMVAHPLLTLRNRQGDCDDMATTLAALHRSTDPQSRHRLLLARAALSVGNTLEYVLAGFTRSQRNPYSHVFLRAYDPARARWVVLDPVAGPNAVEMLKAVRARRTFPV